MRPEGTDIAIDHQIVIFLPTSASTATAGGPPELIDHGTEPDTDGGGVGRQGKDRTL